MEIKVKKVRDNAIIPEYKTDGAVGLDLYACIEEDIILWAPYSTNGIESIAIIPTGIAIEIPEGYEATIRPRSSISAKGIITCLGTIDQDYRGEIKVTLINVSGYDFIVSPGMRIAQLVISPIEKIKFKVVEELSKTERDNKGFGSTGMF